MSQFHYRGKIKLVFFKENTIISTLYTTFCFKYYEQIKRNLEFKVFTATSCRILHIWYIYNEFKNE